MADTPEFNFSRAEKARDEGISRAHGAADDGWKAQALAAVHHVAAERPEFTVDAVQAQLAAWGVKKPREGRAMAGVLKRAEKGGLIEKTGQFVKSNQVGNHANPRMLWRRVGEQASENDREGIEERAAIQDLEREEELNHQQKDPT